MRRLQLTLVAAWMTAWVVGIGVLASVAIGVNGRSQQRDLDSDLALYATATYGLAWFDENGKFHSDLMKLENDLTEGGADIWVVAPTDPPVLHLVPTEAQFEVDTLIEIAREVVRTDEEVRRSGHDANHKPYRVHAIPTYLERSTGAPIAAILVVGDPNPASQAQATFARQIITLALAIGLAGLLVGIALARWSVKPLAAALEQRERFLSAAAHELRSPVASLRAVCDSALAGDETPEIALQRLGPLTSRTSEVLEELLLFARLEAGQAKPNREETRLDLLVEACLPEDDSVHFEAEQSVVVLDAILVRVAVHNLVENALRHSGPSASSIRVSVSGASVIIEDEGPGFPESVLDLVQRPFSVAPSKAGSGIGLATVRMIAELHGGRLSLSNRDGGRARASLLLG